MLIGIVPRVSPVHSQQSAKSVYPLVIANCKENRYRVHDTMTILTSFDLQHYTYIQDLHDVYCYVHLQDKLPGSNKHLLFNIKTDSAQHSSNMCKN